MLNGQKLLLKLKVINIEYWEDCFVIEYRTIKNEG